MDSLGLYVSIPFCRAKCSFCNFASDAFAPGRLPLYLDRLACEIASARTRARRLGAEMPEEVDTLYFGGGTPSLLSAAGVRHIFSALRTQFTFSSQPEITVECAPNQLAPDTLEEFQRQGVNRLSFGIQSFVDAESAAIGRLHTAEQCMIEIDRVRSAGVLNLSLDLIAGLPHQTEMSWRRSVEQAISSGVPHISVYMLEVDDDSRLGREVLRGGVRYGARAVPSDDDSVVFYEIACELLETDGSAQYEISNFARPGFSSVHNLKYWERKPYLGFGLDAHSMLRTASGSLRFANTDHLGIYLEDQTEANLLKVFGTETADILTDEQAFEETLFLGLRKNAGLSLDTLRQEFGPGYVDSILPVLTGLTAEGLITVERPLLRLTARGRVLSNEVFSRLLIPETASFSA